MQVTIKSLSQETFVIDALENDTVFDLKTKLETTTNKKFLANSINLIYNGRILENHQSIKDLNINENKFFVVMTRQDKENNPVDKSTDQVSKNHENLLNSQENMSYDSSESLTDPNQIEAAILNIMNAMNATRDEVQQAFRISLNNPDRTVEYLLQRSSNMTSTQNVSDAQIENNSSHTSPLSFLRDDPQFQQMRSLLQENPNMIQSVLEQIGQTNVGLLELISQNQEDFLELINEPNNFSRNDENSLGQEESHYEIITSDDWEAITRLTDLGFNQSDCIEAYFLFDRNEELAADFLIGEHDDVGE